MNDTLEANDHDSYDQETLDENINTSLRRYSRSKLYALRNNAQSQRRPMCAQRSELQTLSFWKLQMSASGQATEQLVGNSGSVYGDVLSNTNSSGSVASGTHYSSNTRMRERQINFRDRPISSTRGLKMGNAMDTASPRGLKYSGNSVEVSASHSNTSNQKTSYLDQRSNSIAHLMPAFAKKRFVTSASQQSSIGSHVSLKILETQNHEGSTRNSSFESNARLQRGKERIDDSGEYTSPNRRSFHEPERDSGGNGHINSSNLRHTNSLNERRIGSGRLLPRDVNWDYHDKSNAGHRSNSRFTERTATGNSSNFNDKRNLDRRNGSSMGPNENHVSNTHNSGRRYNSDEHTRPQRRTYNEKSDEPEWFSGGPTSQNDTIELRGFDDTPEDYLDDKEDENTFQERQQSSGESVDSENSSTNPKDNYKKEIDNREREKTPLENLNVEREHFQKDENEFVQQKGDMSKEFNFDAFDAIDCQKDIPVSGKSRFTCWFTNNDVKEDDAKLDSPDLSKEAPKTINIMDLFQHAKPPNATIGDVKKLEIPSVEELEARMRQLDVPDKSGNQEYFSSEPQITGELGNQLKQTQTPQDIEAFKKLLDQLKSVENKMEMYEQDRHLSGLSSSPLPLGMVPHVMMLPPDMHHMPPQLVVASGGPPIPNPEEMKRAMQLHHQNQVQSMSPSQQIDPASIINQTSDAFCDHHQKRSEFLNLMHAVARGQIHLIVLEKELNNPNTPLHNKEIISAVLQESARCLTPAIINQPVQLPPMQVLRSSPIHRQGVSSPIPMTMVPPHMTPQQSSIGIPIPQELHVRMLKKKMEEQQQQELNKRRIELNKHHQKNPQQLQHQQSPQHQTQIPATIASPTGQQPRHLNSPTPLAFTPTSVLRKRTAEKDNINPLPHPQPQAQIPPQQKILPQVQTKSPNQGVFVNQSQQPLPPVLSQPRMILGGSHPPPQLVTVPQPLSQHINSPISPQTLQTLPHNLQQRLPPNDVKWQINLGNQQGAMSLNKPIGRPILKGPPPPMPMPPQAQPPPMSMPQQIQVLGQNTSVPLPNQQVPPILFPTKIEMQQQLQQQRLKNETPQHMLNQQMPQGFSGTQHLQQLPQTPQNIIQIPHPQMFQLHHMQQQHMQLQRQMHQQHHSQPHPQPQPQPKTQPQQLQHNESTNCPANFAQQQPKQSNSTEGLNTAANVLVYSREGLSPTSNQLAQWFSPELLAQASAGKLPQINVNQALSLEDFERSIQQHSSTVVHN